MRIRVAVPEEYVQADVINAALEAVTRLDEHMIRSGQSPTSHELVQAGARWHPEPPGDEHFDHGGTIAQRGHGDCDDWAPLHAATMRATGQDPGAAAIVIPSGPNTWHAVVQKSDGHVLTGSDDISVMAGMPPPKRLVVGGEEHMQVYACDPHDGRVYQGSLLPTVGPLSIHCGPQVAVRGLEVAGYGRLYHARCDMPLSGSPLFGVHRKKRHAVIGAEVPYALSCTSHAHNPADALYSAVTGAIMCGDAAEVVPNLDRYKLIAMQMGMSGHPPEAVREALHEMIMQDLELAHAHTGIPGEAHAEQLKAQLAAHGVHVSGCYPGSNVGGFFGDIGKIASGIVHVVSPIINDVAKVAKMPLWGDIIHGIQAAVSVVPGLGTAVSEIIATAETAINAVEAVLSGNPLLFAIHAAENYALASVPGASAIRIIIDPYVSKLLDMAKQKALVDSGALDKMLNAVPDKPKIGPVSPKSLVASLAHILVGHLGMKNTGGKVLPKPAPLLKTLPKPPPTPAARPSKPVPKPAGVAHAAVHVDAPKVAPTPAQAAPTPVKTPIAAAPPRAGLSTSAFFALKPSPPVTHTVTTPQGAHHWHCAPTGSGSWSCSWVIGAAAPAAPSVRAGPSMSASQRQAAIRARARPRGPTAYKGQPLPQAPGDFATASPDAPAAAPPGAPSGASPSGGGGGGGDDGGGAPAPAPDPIVMLVPEYTPEPAPEEVSP
jgi:hypothetical protein